MMKIIAYMHLTLSLIGTFAGEAVGMVVIPANFSIFSSWLCYLSFSLAHIERRESRVPGLKAKSIYSSYLETILFPEIQNVYRQWGYGIDIEELDNSLY
jgi:hypothetical protein